MVPRGLAILVSCSTSPRVISQRSYGVSYRVVLCQFSIYFGRGIFLTCFSFIFKESVSNCYRLPLVVRFQRRHVRCAQNQRYLWYASMHPYIHTERNTSSTVAVEKSMIYRPNCSTTCSPSFFQFHQLSPVSVSLFYRSLSTLSHAVTIDAGYIRSSITGHMSGDASRNDPESPGHHVVSMNRILCYTLFSRIKVSRYFSIHF